MEMHPDAAALAPLLGTWRGRGHGQYPTIRSFDYDDEWVFGHVGKPFVAFVERTWGDTGQPMHTESGYLRAVAASEAEVVASLPTGQAEWGSGTIEVADGVLTVTTDAAVRCTPRAKTVDRIVRQFRVSGDQLHYEMLMEAVGQGLTLHLRAQLHRLPH